MTPQAMRGPELPVGWVLKSSGSRCTISPPAGRCRPRRPSRDGAVSKLKRATPLASATRLGRSPAWLRTFAELAVRAAVGIEVAAGAHSVVAGAIALFVDVEAVLAVGLQAPHFAGHLDHVLALEESDVAAGFAADGRP